MSKLEELSRIFTDALIERGENKKSCFKFAELLKIDIAQALDASSNEVRFFSPLENIRESAKESPPLNQVAYKRDGYWNFGIALRLVSSFDTSPGYFGVHVTVKKDNDELEVGMQGQQPLRIQENDDIAIRRLSTQIINYFSEVISEVVVQ